MEDQVFILVVEDDEEIQTIVEDALTEGGFEPAVAPSGEEAVTLLRGHRGKYRALVADIVLRGRIDGWEVAQRAREIDPEFPIIYMTGATIDVHSTANGATFEVGLARAKVAGKRESAGAPDPGVAAAVNRRSRPAES